MKTSVILEQYAGYSPLGTISETLADLFDNTSAIITGSPFGAEISYAPFDDIRKCDPLQLFTSITAGIDFTDIDPSQTICIFGAAKGIVLGIQNAQHDPNWSPDLFIQADRLVQTLKIPCSSLHVVSTACASGASALDCAVEYLHSGFFKHAIVFGFDLLSAFVVSGFTALGALSKSTCKPFDVLRDGLSVGECGALAVLSCRNPFDGDIVIAGCGSSNDANHRTGPSRTGDGLSAAIRLALTRAHMQPSDVGAIKCHGTATPYNDAMEAKALATIFEDSIPPCFGTKGALGHMSGAGSLFEVIIGAQCLGRGIIPPTVGFSTLGVDELVPVASHTQKCEQSSMLCLSAGFGGINTACLLMEYSR